MLANEQKQEENLADNPYVDNQLIKDLSNFNPQQNDDFISKYQVKTFVFPTEIELPPESFEFKTIYNIDNKDLMIEKYLYNKYKDDINSFNIFYDDILIRFVIGYRHYDDYNKRLQETDKLFQNYLLWHKNSNFDNILLIKQINNINISQYYKGMFIYGQDKYGHPIVYDEGLKTHKNSNNLIKIHKDCGNQGIDDILCYFMRMLHDIKSEINKKYNLKINLDFNNNDRIHDNNRNIGLYQHVYIYDIKELSITNVLMERKFHEYYAKRGSLLCPEIVYKVYIINAPWIFTTIWAIMSKFLHPNTVEKTKILGYDYLNELLKEIDINMIPTKYGGKGKWKINYGSIPTDYPIQINMNYT